ncbi:uncharacterized protein RCO7_14651 [Rhynchosporium graminicola]|uniref:Uncharacterized protein n=1 Tax=Rhynchosporium graminicola TaxID=2792576 RepID=A0A1E1KUF1_9HELO|nr:uncharacterized protein RCO7_14651 [Rhynchosporium commune]
MSLHIRKFLDIAALAAVPKCFLLRSQIEQGRPDYNPTYCIRSEFSIALAYISLEQEDYSTWCLSSRYLVGRNLQRPLWPVKEGTEDGMDGASTAIYERSGAGEGRGGLSKHTMAFAITVSCHKSMFSRLVHVGCEICDGENPRMNSGTWELDRLWSSIAFITQFSLTTSPLEWPP